LGSVLLDFVSPKQPVLTLYLPRGKRPCDIAFFADEVRALYQRLRDITGRTPSDADLHASIHREEAANELLVRLHQQRPALGMKDEALYRLIRSREYLPAEIFSEIVEQALGQAPGEHRVGVPVLLSGIVPEPMSLFQAIDQMGVWLLRTIRACGRRLYPSGRSEIHSSAWLSSSYWGHRLDTRRPGTRAAGTLAASRPRVGARGVIFYLVKFCEPELFYLPDLRRGLQREDIPSLIIEVDIGDPPAERVLTRVKAFLEMIA
jgi:benzoyl-CoA reductase/2-hydroxyglutaryl-CoA dehydratase subunit BcrC/BadD/HgdB